MRKMKCLLAIMFIATLNLSAQISRTVYGIELGSSLDATKTVLKNKGLDYVIQDGSLGLTVMVKDPYFAGIQWDDLFVSFEKNKVYNISFHKQCTETIAKMNLVLELTKLLVNLTDKYSQYQDSTLSNANTQDDKIAFYLKDGITDVVVDGDLKTYGVAHMVLAYIDDKLFNERLSKNEADDL